MPRQSIHYTQTEAADRGSLRVQVESVTGALPIENARVTISYSGDPVSAIEQLSTDASGHAEQVELATPPLEYSMEPDQPQPYAEYNVRVEAEGFQPVDIDGVEVFAGETALQDVRLRPLANVLEPLHNIVIPANTLFGDYPPKIAEAEIKPVNESGEIVLSRVVVPEYVVVHDGVPRDSTAKDYYVRYRDYIKNVASSEIYSTWPDATIRANILAIMSFTLNRVYTEWYRNKGYDFTITSSTAYDHKWIYGRNIFSNISLIVDEIFANYLSRPNVKQPILTQYCDGERVSCPNWMSQWGSKYLGDQGSSAIEILRYYYGSSMYINEAEEISGIPASWPRENLAVGSSGDKVRQIQEQLDRIAQVYSAIPRIAADGNYGPATEGAVRAFQSTFGLPVTGIIDYRTWYKISELYVAITRIAELY
ncbi:MAG: peptidoglycan-binding protein [Lachnospiraceae bacterium]|nr:peptidoglycan-binding protein [Lachnospiraceae bacterium]